MVSSLLHFLAFIDNTIESEEVLLLFFYYNERNPVSELL